MKSSNKGQGITMVFLAITIMAMIAGLAAFAQVYKLPPEFSDRVNELGVMTAAETRLDDTRNHFIPVAAHYGVAQAAHHWGDEKNFIYLGDGDQDESDNDADEMKYYTNLINNVDRESQEWFENYTNTLSYNDGCNVQTDDATVNLSFESQNITINASSGDPLVTVRCSRDNIEVFTRSEPGGKIEENMTNIRFHELAQGMIKAMKEAEKVSETIESNDRHWGTYTDNASCVYSESAYSNPRDEAKDAAYDEAVSYVVNNIFKKIETAILDRDHGIGSGSNRGAKQALWKYTHGGDLCIFGYCLADAFMDDISSRNTYIIDNDTSITEQNVNSYRCGCDEWECNQDPDSEYSYSIPDHMDGGSCEHDDETFVGSNPYSAHCSHEDADASDGSCSQSDYSGFRPSPTCPFGYSYNSTSNQCEDGSGGTTSRTCTDSTDGDGDDDWDYDGFNSCDWDDGSFGSPYCNEQDFEHDGSGGCELEEEDLGTTDRPNPKCVDKVYNADSTVEYRYKEIFLRLEIFDDKYKIPTNDGWKHLALHRRYRREFVKNP